MKIAIVCDMIYPFSIGGAEIRNYEIAKRLVKKGHEVHLYGVKLWAGEKTIKKEGIIIHGVCRYKNLYSFSGKRSILEPMNFAIALLPEVIKENFDIIDASSFAYFHCFSLAILSKVKRKPLVITWHQYWGSYWYPYLGKLKGIMGRIIENLAIRLTRNHLAVSKTTKNDLMRHGAKEVFISYNGVDLDRIRDIKEKISHYNIIFVGRLAHQKNVQLLIKTVAILKKYFDNLKIAIIGDGPDMKKLKKLSSDLNLNKNIDFLGFQKLEEVYRYMKSSEIFVLPSLLEGFGIVVIEANACGIPVVVIDTKWNASKELITNNGVISKNDPRELANSIKEMLKDKYLLREMSKNSIKKAQSFDWGPVADKIENYYLSLLK
jgi:glycosyltransferase involved in cell wall biosynthesis